MRSISLKHGVGYDRLTRCFIGRQFRSTLLPPMSLVIKCFNTSPHLHPSLVCNTRLALRIANRATPISANTASQRVATPIAPKGRKTTFTPKAMIIFCQTIRRVRRAIAIASATIANYFTVDRYFSLRNMLKTSNYP